MIYNVYKERGETPLECLQRFKHKQHIEQGRDRDEKWAYFGRLDPMAEGVLILATGEDIKRRNEFLDLDKEYEFNVLFGFSTDTYDVLGKILRVEKLSQIDENHLRKVVAIYEGERDQKYPPFSSKTVSGRAMHEWARMEKLHEIEIPSKKVKIFKIGFSGIQKLSAKELLGRLLMDISKVKGDFRQHDSLILWKEMLDGYPGDVFVGKMNAYVSSGTYIRSIVNDIGNTIGCGACALSITRNKVGDYTIQESIRL